MGNSLSDGVKVTEEVAVMEASSLAHEQWFHESVAASSTGQICGVVLEFMVMTNNNPSLVHFCDVSVTRCCFRKLNLFLQLSQGSCVGDHTVYHLNEDTFGSEMGCY